MQADLEKETQPQPLSSKPPAPVAKPRFPWPMANTKTGWYFFYGTVMDPSVLAAVLQVKEPPRLRPARIIGYETRLWGPYPALVCGEPGHEFQGMACEILLQEHLDRLIAYETEKYFIPPVWIYLLDVGVGRQERVQGRVFKWDAELDELKEGGFDLKRYLREKQLEEMGLYG